MHRISMLLVTVGLAIPAGAGQPAGGMPAIDPCSLLTKELITKVSPNAKQSLTLVLAVPPEPSGMGCEYGGVYLQVYVPASPAQDEKQALKDKGWTRLSGVGDVAYYRDNRGQYGELYARAGARVLTLQMSIPTGKTAASIQPNVVELAQALLPKLR